MKKKSMFFIALCISFFFTKGQSIFEDKNIKIELIYCKVDTIFIINIENKTDSVIMFKLNKGSSIGFSNDTAFFLSCIQGWQELDVYRPNLYERLYFFKALPHQSYTFLHKQNLNNIITQYDNRIDLFNMFEYLIFSNKTKINLDGKSCAEITKFLLKRTDIRVVYVQKHVLLGFQSQCNCNCDKIIPIENR